MNTRLDVKPFSAILMSLALLTSALTTSATVAGAAPAPNPPPTVSGQQQANPAASAPANLVVRQNVWAATTPLTITVGGWAKTWGGTSASAMAKNIAVDQWDNVYVVGEYAGTVNFDPAGSNPSATFSSHNNTVDAFISKFDASGNFVWAKTWGAGYITDRVQWGEGRDAVNGVALDGSGNVYVSGLYQNTVDFNPAGGATHTSNAPDGKNNIFVSKFAPDGTFQWVRTWGASNGGGESYSLAVDMLGYVYVQGDWSGTVCDFNQAGPTHDIHVNHGFYDAFLSKWDSNGNFQWASTWGGEGYDDGASVAVDDASGNVYVGGMYASTDITFTFDPAGTDPAGLGHPAHNSGAVVDVFLSKFDSNGIFQWVRTWGGPDADDAGGTVAVDGAGNVYIGGRFGCTGCNFNAGPGGPADNHSSQGDLDAFVSKYDSSGNFLWARTWGGTGWDATASVSVDEANQVYASGLFSTTVNFGGGPVVSLGLWDAFLIKYDSSGTFQTAKTWGGSDQDGAYQTTVDAAGNAYVTGFFSSPGAVPVDFEPGYMADRHTAQGVKDAFYSKVLSQPAVLTATVFLPLVVR
jgi:hypothetical protein